MRYRVTKATSTSGNAVTFHLSPVEEEPRRGTYETDIFDDLATALAFLDVCAETTENV